jgi:HD-like signal output (HDOD) protein
LSDLLDRLKPGGLPVFRHTREALIAMAPRRDGLTAREVATDLLKDPLATLHILHVINAKVADRYGTEVSTVEHALMMQGLGAFLDGVRSLPLVEDTALARDPRALRAVHALVRRAQHAAWQARDFAVLHTDIHAEEVQVAALLHPAAEILLWLRAPDLARKLNRLRRKGVEPEEAESETLGMSLAALRLRLLDDWRIPELTRDLLDERYAERPRQAILHACLGIAAASERGWWDEALMPHYLDLASVENQPIESVIATVHGNAARSARCCNWLDAPAAGTWGPMNPGDWPPEPEDDEEDKPAGAAPVPAPKAPSPDHFVCAMPDKQVFRDTLKGIESHLDGSYTLNQMSAVILKGLHTGLSLSRVLFAMITPEDRVKMRFSIGIGPEDPLRRFDFPLGSKDLFGQLMGKMQGVWINEGNRDRLWPMVDPRLQTLVGAGDFYAMSLFSGSRPVGLIYADRGHGECGLDPLTYTDFKMLCLQAARGLGKLKQ